jgi:hypothetical protein
VRVKARADISGIADQQRIAALERLLSSVNAKIVFIDYDSGSILVRADPCLLRDSANKLTDLIQGCVFRLTLFVKPAAIARTLCSGVVKVSRDLERCLIDKAKGITMVADISLSKDYARLIVIGASGLSTNDLSNPLILRPTEFPCNDILGIISEISVLLPVCRVE